MTSIHAELLNELDEMARGFQYALRRETIQEAVWLISRQEREINFLTQRLRKAHFWAKCERDNCKLDGGKEHDEYFAAGGETFAEFLAKDL